MRKIQFLIFFSVFLVVYAIVNSYIFIRGWEVIPAEFHPLYIGLFTFLSWSFLAGRLLERLLHRPAAN